MGRITVVGGGLAGLVASISCAEGGADVRLLEAHHILGGRARSSTGPYAANLGPHVIYDDGPLWAWLVDRGLAGHEPRAPLHGIRFRHGGRLRRTPPAAMAKLLKIMRRRAPVDLDFRTWATSEVGPEAAELGATAAGVFAFDADPGRLSAAFVWERLVRVSSLPPSTRYIVGGWGRLVDTLADHARSLGVEIQKGVAVDALPPSPVIAAMDLAAARRLLHDDSLRWEGTRTALLDVGMEARRGDPFIISDLDAPGWAERFTAPDPTLAPAGHSLVQVQVGARPGEPLDDAVRRMEDLLDVGFPDWRGRERWRRRSLVDHQTGALDLPGTTWRDRPPIDRGDGVFLAGDMVAAPGLLGEVAFNSAVEASRLALTTAERRTALAGQSTTSTAAPLTRSWARSDRAWSAASRR